MTRILIALAALSLSGCAPLLSSLLSAGGVPSAPQQVADRTKLDEQALLGVELAYKGARIAMEVTVDSGQCTGQCATRFRTINRRAYETVGLARAAYGAANAPSYFAALGEARSLITEMVALTGRDN